MFNEDACGVVNGQLNRLNDSFNNVSFTITSVLSDLSLTLPLLPLLSYSPCPSCPLPSLTQLTAASFEGAVSMFTRVVEQTAGSEVEQSDTVLNTVSTYFTDIATFVTDTNATVEPIVSLEHTLHNTLMSIYDSLIGCEQCNSSSQFSSSMEPTECCCAE